MTWTTWTWETLMAWAWETNFKAEASKCESVLNVDIGVEVTHVNTEKNVRHQFAWAILSRVLDLSKQDYPFVRMNKLLK